MKVLVIGATGQVGHLICEQLRADGDVVIAAPRTGVSGVERCDLEQPEEVARFIRRHAPDAVIQTGGWTDVDCSEDDPPRAMRINADGTQAAADAARSLGAHYTFFSTDYVFDGERGPVDEDADPRPLSHYGRSKLEGERRAGKDALIIRTANIYSYRPGDRNFFMQVLERLRSGGEFFAYTNQWGTPTYAPALAEAVIGEVRRGTTGILHLAGPEFVSRWAWARRIALDFGFDAGRIVATTTQERPQRAPRPARGGVVSKRRLPVGPSLAAAHAQMRRRLGL